MRPLLRLLTCLALLAGPARAGEPVLVAVAANFAEAFAAGPFQVLLAADQARP